MTLNFTPRSTLGAGPGRQSGEPAPVRNEGDWNDPQSAAARGLRARVGNRLAGIEQRLRRLEVEARGMGFTPPSTLARPDGSDGPPGSRPTL